MKFARIDAHWILAATLIPFVCLSFLGCSESVAPTANESRSAPAQAPGADYLSDEVSFSAAEADDSVMESSAEGDSGIRGGRFPAAESLSEIPGEAHVRSRLDGEIESGKVVSGTLPTTTTPQSALKQEDGWGRQAPGEPMPAANRRAALAVDSKREEAVKEVTGAATPERIVDLRQKSMKDSARPYNSPESPRPADKPEGAERDD